MGEGSAFARVFCAEIYALNREALVQTILFVRGQYGREARAAAEAMVAGMSDERVQEAVHALAEV